MSGVAELFEPDGPLASGLPGYAPREVQQAMATAVAETLAQGDTLVVEAGTGAGKTYAYLVPALLSGRKVLISTGTRALQDQLWEHDLPRLRGALGSPARVALLKGRANYICRVRLEQHQTLAGFGANAGPLARIARHVAEHDNGDVAAVRGISPQDPVWPLATSNADNCLGGECPVYGDCYLIRARRAAQLADVVIVNHHLLLSDWALRAAAGGEVLPDADAVIFDEAHLLAELAGSYFGTGVGSQQLLELARDARAEAQLAAAAPAVADECANLELAAGALLRVLPAGAGRVALGPRADDFAPPMDEAAAALAALGTTLRQLADHSTGLARCAQRAADLLGRLATLRDPEVPPQVLCAERRERSLSLHAYPLDVAPAFAQALTRYNGGHVFTSATLAVDGAFEHFTRALGIPQATTLALPGTYDYATRALLYVPTGLPAPSDPAFNTAIADALSPVLAASHGRAFVLCTSHDSVNRIGARLRATWDGTVLVQGSAPPAALLEAFRTGERAVLVGAASFWQGVDVPGAQLSCVIVVKLPFAAPGDPLLAARLEYLEQQGGDAFRDYQLPQAVLMLRQGLGRLLRGPEDRGVLVVGDTRLLGRGYGKVFLRSLPPAPVTRELAEVQQFFEAGP